MLRLSGLFLLPLLCIFMLGGCAEKTVEEPGGVQDIQPGDRSIIDSPPAASPEPAIEERNI